MGIVRLSGASDEAGPRELPAGEDKRHPSWPPGHRCSSKRGTGGSWVTAPRKHGKWGTLETGGDM